MEGRLFVSICPWVDSCVVYNGKPSIFRERFEPIDGVNIP
jgi:hypothetical protein